MDLGKAAARVIAFFTLPLARRLGQAHGFLMCRGCRSQSDDIVLGTRYESVKTQPHHVHRRQSSTEDDGWGERMDEKGLRWE